MNRPTFLGLLAAPLALAAGCRQPAPLEKETTYKVRGRVVGADGQPVRAGRVNFYPESGGRGLEAWGEIQPDGSFTLTTYTMDDGVIPANYVVTVSPYSYKTGNPRPVDAATARQILAKYRSQDSTTLTVEVGPRDAELDPFVLK